MGYPGRTRRVRSAKIEPARRVDTRWSFTVGLGLEPLLGLSCRVSSVSRRANVDDGANGALPELSPCHRDFGRGSRQDDRLRAAASISWAASSSRIDARGVSKRRKL